MAQKQRKIAVDQLRGVVNMGREAEESMEEPLHVMICVDTKCPRWLALALRDAFMPERDARVDVCVLDGHPVVKNVDVGIIASGGSESLVRGAIRSFAGARQHVIVVAETSLDIPETHLPAKLGQFIADVVASEHGPLYDRLANALLDSTEKDVSCAANFAFCRDVATARLVSRVAARNAVMGVADFIPGAGMPLMTMNQINMGFDIAATYGRGLSLGRAPEVAVIVAAGLLYREAAHLLMRIMPRMGLITKIFVAYGGTLVTGRLLASHFVQGLPESDEEGAVEAEPETIVAEAVVSEAVEA
jgi:uncharacterized protein (DUF697 family)